MDDKVHRTRFYRCLQLFHFVNDGLILIYPIIMVEYFSMFSLSYYQTGLVYSMNTLMIIIMQIVNGYLADKGKVKFLIIFGISGVTISSLLLHLVINYNILLIVSIISGFFFGIVHAINYTTTIRLFPEDSNLKLARQGFMGDLGKLIAIFLSSILTMLLPLYVTIITWNCVCVITAIYVFIQMGRLEISEETLLADIEEMKKSSGSSALETKDDDNTVEHPDNSTGSFLRGSALIFLLQFLFNAYFDLVLKNTPTYLFDAREGLLSEYSKLVFAVLYLIGSVGIYNADFFKRKLGRSKHFISAYIVMILTLLIFQLIHTNSIILTILLLGPNFGIGLSIYTNIFDEASKKINKKKLGLNMSLLLAFGWFGGFISTWIGGRIADINPDNLIWQSIIINVLSLIVTIMLVKKKKLQG